MKLKDKQSILFTGDSITDCGRARPTKTGEGLGEGYVAMIDNLLVTAYAERQIKVLNSGISGNRVTDLERHCQKDILDHTPDWLSIMIGINDVWRQFDSLFNFNQVKIDRYETIYRKLLERTRKNLKGLVLLSPYMIEPNLANPMREQMDAYGRVVERLAEEFDAIFVNVQTAFDLYLTHHPWQSLCDDHIHPNKTGHMIIARSFLNAIQFDWDLIDDEIKIDM